MNNDMFNLIEQQLAQVPYGTIQFTIKRHDSHTTSIDGQKLTSHKTETNEQALSIILALLKSAQINQESGNLTFTIVLDKGSSSRVIVQDLKRVAFS